MESMSNNTTVDDISSDIGRMGISQDVDVSSRDDMNGHEEEMEESEKKYTSCEQKLDQIGVDASTNADIDMVSKEVESDVDVLDICANCGKEGATNTCNKCKSVKYCNAVCKKKHKTKHKKACDRRVAELHDIELFKEPPSEEDCPICFLRLPTHETGRRYKTCCGKVICSGCIHAPIYDDQGHAMDNKICAFCRTPTPTTDKEIVNRLMRRVDANDAKAMRMLGDFYYDGRFGLPQDHTKALELYHRAAELGDATAYSNIGVAYYNGQGVNKDKKKALHCYELAAMGGYIEARYRLGAFEEDAGNIDRALRHYIISVEGGVHKSLKQIQKLYSNGHASKEEYVKALRAYQKYLDEVKSSQRDQAAAYSETYKYIV